MTATAPTASSRIRRSRLRTIVALAGLGLAGMTLGGCNSSNNALLEANRALQDRNTALTQQNESLNRLNQELQKALGERDTLISSLNATINDLRGGTGDMQARLNELNEKFGKLNFGRLDPATDQAMQDLARQHPELLEWDSVRGMLRFKNSDLTFASGSDQVRDTAQSTLASLANILNGAAAQYDIRIVGHTDAQRMSSGTAQKHSSNIRLSADRAISVRNVLAGDDVSKDRMEVAGWGEFQPLVANSGNGNTPLNRRVEIFLVKPFGNKIGVTEAEATPVMASPRPTTPAPAKPTREEEIMK